MLPSQVGRKGSCLHKRVNYGSNSVATVKAAIRVVEVIGRLIDSFRDLTDKGAVEG